MNRLLAELGRLYLVPTSTEGAPGAQPPTMVSASGTVRALVMELMQPPGWEVLSRVWQGVQAEFGLPAPAIAVSGQDALQLWFSLAEPVPAARGHAFLEGLQRHFMADVDARRVRLKPAHGPSSTSPEAHARMVPARQEQTGNWSAFLAADLVPIFAETPWLDIAPSEEGQAALLQGLAMIEPTAFDAAFDRLARAAQPSPASAGADASRVGTPNHASAGPLNPEADPRQFLVRVMQDASVPLALRIEAAKALLPHAGRGSNP
jgi:hypothetical protein